MDAPRLFFSLARFALNALVHESAGALLESVGGHFTDRSLILLKALEEAAEQTGKVCELVFDSGLTDRLLASGEVKALALPLQQAIEAQGDAFSKQCRDEWKRARRDGPLAAEPLNAGQLAQGAAGLKRIGDPQGLIRAAANLMAEQTAILRRSGYPGLAQVLDTRLAEGESPFLPALYGYFVRRAVAKDAELAAQLQFDGLQRLGDIAGIIDHKADRILEAVQALRGDLRPQQSFSLHSDSERQAVKRLLELYRALPDERRGQLPHLLGQLGRLQFVAGEPVEALRLFQQAATQPDLVQTGEQAACHHAAHLAALEAGDLASALTEIQRAAQLDPARYAPFPFQKYRPEAILGAGGFGVAYRCHHTRRDKEVVVKALHPEQLARNPAELFREAHLLDKLDHPAIVGLEDCDYADPGEQRPYLVLEWFPDSLSLDDYLKCHGALDAKTARALAQPLAEALAAAHAAGILHRDLKPANLLVRREGNGWGLKVIDFGLGLKQASPGSRWADLGGKSLIARSLTGTLNFAPPEQRGDLAEPVGPWSDIYAYGKTLAFALFQRTELQRADWRRLEGEDEGLAELLERCVAYGPKERFQGFGAVLEMLGGIQPPAGLKPAGGSAAAPEPVGAVFNRDATPGATPQTSSVTPASQSRLQASPMEAERSRILVPQDIHGWPAEKVQALQRRVAEVLGMPVGFRDRLKDGGKGPEMLIIPPGCFLMGSSKDESERSNSDETQHPVTISKPFAIGRYSLTFDEYDAFCIATGRSNPHDSGWGRGDRPVINVSWEDATTYCEWLSGQSGQIYRLPTEAEWEYACRGGTATSFWWGKTITTAQANYGWDSGNDEADVERWEKTLPVKSFKPNPWGLYHVHGNVAEWCCDGPGEYPSEPVTDPEGASDGPQRNVRGGSWDDIDFGCRAAHRDDLNLSYRFDSLGFRCVRVLIW